MSRKNRKKMCRRFRGVLVVVVRRVLKWNPTRGIFCSDKPNTQNRATNDTGSDIKIVRFAGPPRPPNRIIKTRNWPDQRDRKIVRLLTNGPARAGCHDSIRGARGFCETDILYVGPSSALLPLPLETQVETKKPWWSLFFFGFACSAWAPRGAQVKLDLAIFDIFSG